MIDDYSFNPLKIQRHKEYFIENICVCMFVIIGKGEEVKLPGKSQALAVPIHYAFVY